MSKRYRSASIKVEFSAGADISDAAEEAMGLANKLDILVEFKFNNVTCFCRPGENWRTIPNEYKEAQASMAKYKFASSSPITDTPEQTSYKSHLTGDTIVTYAIPKNESGIKSVFVGGKKFVPEQTTKEGFVWTDSLVAEFIVHSFDENFANVKSTRKLMDNWKASKQSPQKQKIFTTEDGVDMFVGSDYWVIDNNDTKFYIWSGRLSDGQDLYLEERKYFSTKEAAEAYVAKQKEPFSWNDNLVKEYQGFRFWELDNNGKKIDKSEDEIISKFKESKQSLSNTPKEERKRPDVELCPEIKYKPYKEEQPSKDWERVKELGQRLKFSDKSIVGVQFFDSTGLKSKLVLFDEKLPSTKPAEPSQFDIYTSKENNDFLKKSIEEKLKEEQLSKDWEIVSLADTYGGGYVVYPFTSEPKDKDRFKIHSVRRLSDGEAFSVGETVEASHWGAQKIVKFISDTGKIIVGFETCRNPLSGIKKLPSTKPAEQPSKERIEVRLFTYPIQHRKGDAVYEFETTKNIPEEKFPLIKEAIENIINHKNK